MSSIHERGSATIGHEADPASEPPASVDVFVSYAREDGEFVRGLADELAAHGHPVWLDATRIPQGDRLRGQWLPL
jgi:hypothetical protein